MSLSVRPCRALSQRRSHRRQAKLAWLVVRIFTFSFISFESSSAQELGSGPIDAETVSVGHFKGRAAILVLPSRDVERLLPRGLRLAPDPSLPSDLAALTAIFFELDQPRGQTQVEASPPRSERGFLIAVNSVQRPRDPRPYVYIDQLFFERWTSILKGWRFRARRGTISDSSDSGSDPVLIHGTQELTRFEIDRPASYDEAQLRAIWKQVNHLFLRPVITRSLLGWRCSQPLADPQNASISPLSGRWTFAGPWRSIFIDRFDSLGLDVSPFGGFQFAMNWRLQESKFCGPAPRLPLNQRASR